MMKLSASVRASSHSGTSGGGRASVTRKDAMSRSPATVARKWARAPKREARAGDEVPRYRGREGSASENRSGE